MLSTEYHIHLFGCITAEDLLKKIRSFEPDQIPDLTWYQGEFKKAYDREPDITAYLSSDLGIALEALKKDYLCDKQVTFTQFQASFNLAIALHPDRFNDHKILKTSFTRLADQGVTFAEFKIVLSPKLNDKQKQDYLTLMAQNADLLSDEHKRCTLSVSLFRTSDDLIGDYRLVKKWQKENTEIAQLVTSLDFCMDEQVCSPNTFAELVQTVKHDNNQASQTSLDLVVHAGEIFDRIGISISTSWIVQWLHLGVRRIGHGLSMGVPEDQRDAQKVISKSILLDFLQDSMESLIELREHGFPYTLEKLRLMAVEINDSSQQEFLWPPSADVSKINSSWQKYALSKFRSKNAFVEICPTSNANLCQHPVEGVYDSFKKENLNYMISSDDPGIFDTNLAQEEKILQTRYGWTDDCIRKSNLNASKLAAEFPSLK